MLPICIFFLWIFFSHTSPIFTGFLLFYRSFKIYQIQILIFYISFIYPSIIYQLWVCDPTPVCKKCHIPLYSLNAIICMSHNTFPEISSWSVIIGVLLLNVHGCGNVLLGRAIYLARPLGSTVHVDIIHMPVFSSPHCLGHSAGLEHKILF